MLSFSPALTLISSEDVSVEAVAAFIFEVVTSFAAARLRCPALKTSTRSPRQRKYLHSLCAITLFPRAGNPTIAIKSRFRSFVSSSRFFHAATLVSGAGNGFVLLE